MKPDATSLGIDSQSAVHSVFATSSKHPRKRKVRRLENTTQNSSSAKSLHYEIWGPTQWRDWETTAMCSKQCLELCQTHFQAHRERQSYILLAPGRLGTPGCVNKKSRMKWWIPELVCIWSVRETLTLLSWRPWRHREVRRRWWLPTERCKRGKKPLYMSKNWTYSWRLCFSKELPQFFLSGSSATIMGIFTTGPARSKNTFHPKGQEVWLQFFKLCAIRSPCFICEFFCNAHTYFFIIFNTRFCIWHKQIHRKCSTRKRWKYELGAMEKPAA